MADDVLRGPSPHFDALYARSGRPPIARQRLLRARRLL
jgi:hypothetical protein